MTLSDEEASLPGEVEHLLHHWAVPEKEEAEWSALAEAIDARIARVKPGRGEGDEWLFLPPLPLMNGERVLEPQATAASNFDVSAPPDSHTSGVQNRLVSPLSGSEQPRRKFPSATEASDDGDPRVLDRTSGVHPSDARSLKDIAEEALRDARGLREAHARGQLDLGKLNLGDKRNFSEPQHGEPQHGEPQHGEPQHGATRSVTALPTAHRRRADSGIQLSRAVASATTPGDSLHPSGASSAGVARLRSASEGSTLPHQPRRASRVLHPFLWLTGVVAAAAAILLWFGRQGASPDVATTEAPMGREVERPTSPERAAVVEPDEPSAKSKDEASQVVAENVANADELPLAVNTPKAAARQSASRPTARPPVESELSSSDEGTQAKTQEPALIPAADLNSRPAHPSVGAAQAAVGATLAPARLCVVGRLAPSQATVIFGSDGHVRSVRVHGDAAGTPAEGCIQRAMGTARVRPFSDESFSVRTTVRP